MSDYDGLDSEFRRRLEAMVQASGGRLYIVSGFRSVEEQTALWNDALAKYGPEEAGNWVAPPGRSNHNHGVAVDLGYSDNDAQAWAHANAAKYGLVYPMEWEPWHIEPAGVRDGTYQSDVQIHFEGDGHDHAPGTAEAYTNAPPGYQSATDATRRFDLGYQLAQLGGIMAGQVPDILSGLGKQTATAAQPTTRITGGGDGAL